MNNFDGQTWVAFSDLSGLKKMYSKSHKKAAKALSKFYSSVYNLQQSKVVINAIVVSDCAVFWIDKQDCKNELSVLLDKVKQLHQKMLPDYLLRTTIAYGHFKYQQRIEMPTIRKNMIIGGAYLDAFMKNDKIEHGAIVIVELPSKMEMKDIINDDYVTKKIQGKFYEYFWMLNNKSEIKEFVKRRKEIQENIFENLKKLYINKIKNSD